MDELAVKRSDYVEKALLYLDKPVIKVITGMRRCGKSAILRQIYTALRERGVADDRILYLNFESQNLASLANAPAIYQYVSDYAKKAQGRLYIMLDEVQYISDWERAIASFRVDFDCDIYITGSNASLLSGDLSTLLGGRFVSIPVYPLSFREFLEFTQVFGENTGKSREQEFTDFLRFGGLPGIHEMNINTDAVYPYLMDIFNSIMLKDVITRRRIRDAELLERIVMFIMDNIGHIFSAKTIGNFLKGQGRRLSVETVYNYLGALEEAYLIRKVRRYDIKGKRHLETLEKYFLEDFGLRSAMQGYRGDTVSGVLENVVFMELTRRGFTVSIGKFNQMEIDFIAEFRDQKAYIQVCYLLSDSTVVEREFAPLLGIQDNYPKFVLSLDTLWDYNKEGVQRRNLIDFLLDKGALHV